ncbi:MAG: hypothetical protein ACJ71O_18170 [Nitrososphaeraceae archaeon]
MALISRLRCGPGLYLKFMSGNPDDYVVEVASRAWFGSLAWPGAVGLVIGRPVGLAPGVAVWGIIAYEFEKMCGKNSWK